jgi:hypothetical protein
VLPHAASTASEQSISAETRALFKKPPASFRPTPLWAWNADLDDDEADSISWSC